MSLNLAFARNRAGIREAPRTNPMNALLMAVGCVLMALVLMMLANRAGYVRFVVGPGLVAGAVAMLAFWIFQVVPR
jgi:hypothetical protein